MNETVGAALIGAAATVVAAAFTLLAGLVTRDGATARRRKELLDHTQLLAAEAGLSSVRERFVREVEQEAREYQDRLDERRRAGDRIPRLGAYASGALGLVAGAGIVFDWVSVKQVVVAAVVVGSGTAIMEALIELKVARRRRPITTRPPAPEQPRPEAPPAPPR